MAPPRRRRISARLGKRAEPRQSLDSVASLEPAWGIIAHPGWSSPCSPDLPNLQYEPVIVELSHLIEAKAVSLAPPDPLSPSPGLDGNLDQAVEAEAEAEAEAPIPDPVAVELLQRPASMGLRDYLSHLAAVGMLDLDPLVSDFSTRYEYARYSGQDLDEGEFRTLMGVFAEILRRMRPLDVSIVDEMRADDMDPHQALSSSESDDDDHRDEAGDAESVHTTETVQRTPRPDEPYSSSSSSSLASANPSSPSPSQGTLHTAPSRPPATRNPSSMSRRSAMNQRSLSSLRRTRTGTSSSGYSARSTGAGSVIRLKEAKGPLDLPYAILTGDGKEL